MIGVVLAFKLRNHHIDRTSVHPGFHRTLLYAVISYYCTLDSNHSGLNMPPLAIIAIVVYIQLVTYTWLRSLSTVSSCRSDAVADTDQRIDFDNV